MKRFETATHPAVYWLIAATMAVVFFIDIRTPIGVATWILSLLPILMCFLVPKPWLPLLLAAVSTGLILADWFLSPAGISQQVAQVNRTMGAVCIWSTAILAQNTLATRTRLREQDWLRVARAGIGAAGVGGPARAPMAARGLAH